jgi:general secretion pathway protein E/type IV pilus assembly protein PilB
MEAGEMLKRRGLLSDSQLNQLRQANGDGASLIEKAVALGYVREEAALRALAEEVGLEYVDLRDMEVDLSLLQNFPHKLIHRQSLFPIRRDNGQWWYYQRPVRPVPDRRQRRDRPGWCRVGQSNQICPD